MKRVFIVLASGLLLLAGSAVRAGDGGVPGTLQLAPAPAGAAPSCCAAAPCCAPKACESDCGGHSGRFLDWLCYKPARCHACCCHVSNCWPPLYNWFTDMCQGGGCGHGACGHAAPCAGGGCGHEAVEVVAPH
jgi:hypothetical protein